MCSNLQLCLRLEYGESVNAVMIVSSVEPQISNPFETWSTGACPQRRRVPGGCSRNAQLGVAGLGGAQFIGAQFRGSVIIPEPKLKAFAVSD